VRRGFPLFYTVGRKPLQKTGADAEMISCRRRPPLMRSWRAADAAFASMLHHLKAIPSVGAWPGEAVTLECREWCACRANWPGRHSPGECKIGIMPATFQTRRVGVIKPLRHGSPMKAVWQPPVLGLGQSTCGGIGGDPIPGTTQIDCLKLFAG